MCLDPRPESLVRVRPSAIRSLPQARPAVLAAAAPGAASHSTSTDAWVTALADGLDARGWTLVTRTAAC